MSIIEFSAADLSKKLQNKDISSVEVTQASLDRIASVDGKVNAFIHVNSEKALADAKKVDERRLAGDNLHPLAGIPIAVKDLLCTKDQPTTAASKMLEGYRPPYDATVVKKLRQAGMVILGKTNLDEFAMGSSTEHSAYGVTRNPWDLDRIPGGSGGGSAAAVAAFEVPLAIGTDTGGSIRQPAAVTGTVGVKPTYGGVSRYGVISLASSLDQVGPVGRSVLDTALLHELISGYDPMDSTSLQESAPNAVAASCFSDISGMRIGVIKELDGAGCQPGVKKRFDETVYLLESAGAEIVEVSCPNFHYSLGAYYILMSSEASSNLARFDAVRYGKRSDNFSSSATIEQVVSQSRGEYLGQEVKRRIILGTYALSAGYYDAYYLSAQKVRTLVQRDFAAAFSNVDVLVSPTTPTTAFKFGEKISDPLAMYINDIATIPANLAGIPGISLPNGLAEGGLPSGVQLLAPAKSDARLYQVASVLETLFEASWGHSMISEVQDFDSTSSGGA